MNDKMAALQDRQRVKELEARVQQLEKTLRDVIKVAEAEYCTLTDGEHGSLYKWSPAFQRAHKLLEASDD